MKTKVDEIYAITDNSNDYLQAIFLDFWSNFLTLEAFANHYSLSLEEAQVLLRIAKRVHEERTKGV